MMVKTTGWSWLSGWLELLPWTMKGFFFKYQRFIRQGLGHTTGSYSILIPVVFLQVWEKCLWKEREGWDSAHPFFFLEKSLQVSLSQPQFQDPKVLRHPLSVINSLFPQVPRAVLDGHCSWGHEGDRHSHCILWGPILLQNPVLKGCLSICRLLAVIPSHRIRHQLPRRSQDSLWPV